MFINKKMIAKNLGSKRGNMQKKNVHIMNASTTSKYFMFYFAQLGDAMTAVERIVEYTHLPREEEEDVDDDDDDNADLSAIPDPTISFTNFSFRYRDDLPLVLRNITAKIVSGEKVGIVGRTGAGKSSLFMCLTRLVDVGDGDENGVISIGNRDIRHMRLSSLRRMFCVIPQQPILFPATLRYNLDPMGQFKDGVMVEVMREVQLERLGGGGVEVLGRQVSHQIDNNDDDDSDDSDADASSSSSPSPNSLSLSFGEAQLVCVCGVPCHPAIHARPHSHCADR